ncbi:MAG TPA: nucleotide pyrophosphohydrolase [Acidimicrobiia bacterium]|nr:nucleotide pyrophosphohydrolase [Acidimicrobiia bacterium]
MSRSVDVTALAQFLREFAADRDWEQYHTPKNLAMALAAEAGELLDIFQWLTAEESVAVMSDPDRARAVQEEIADVFQYLVRLADILGVDIEEAVWEKLRHNESRFPS